MKPIWPFALIAAMLAAWISPLLSSAVSASEPGPVNAQAPAAAHVIFVPLVSRSPGMIYGRVTESGVPAGGVTVSLRFFNGASWSTHTTAETDNAGRFKFTEPASLSGGQRYQVTFDNVAGNDSRLAWWGTRHLANYTVDLSTHIGDFDIAAVHLAEPAHQATLGLPGTFRWTRRPATSTDSYALRLYDPNDLNPFYVSPYVGYGDGFTLNSLPDGFRHSAYAWDVILLAPDGAAGVSRQARSVRFAGGINGQVTQNGAPAGGVSLQLRFFNGFWWSTLASTTTSDDGAYAFTNAPGLAHGQKYYVRYENNTQTVGRLFLWSTRVLNDYAAGAAVNLGSFDLADVALVAPPGGSSLALPSLFQWARRPATPADTYLLEIYDPSDYQPRWLSPLLGYGEHYTLNGLAPLLATHTPYAWDLVITSPEGGSGVSRTARLIQFTNRGDGADAFSAIWPFEEELPPRPPEGLEAVGEGRRPDEAGRPTR